MNLRWVPSFRWGDLVGFLLAAFLILLATSAAAQTFPQLTGRVVDQANLLNPQQEGDLDRKLAGLETQTGRQFVIATVASLIKTRGELIDTDESLVEPETADRIPSQGPEALAEAEPRLGADSDEERSRR